MGQFLIRRIFLTIFVLLGVSTVVFLLLRLVPGDVVDVMLGAEAKESPENVVYLRSLFGLDQPLHVQYFHWLAKVSRGDLGRSILTGQPVSKEIMSRLPVTLEVALLSLMFAVLSAIPIGVFSAIKHRSVLDSFIRVLSLVGLSIPNFWLGILLILLSSLYLGVLPPVTYTALTESPIQNLAQMLFPTIALGAALGAITARMTRSSMLEVVRQDYIMTARAKGLSNALVIYEHALKNALIPVITIIGIQFGTIMIGGAVIIEQVFSLPGVGRLVLTGIYLRDYPVVQGAILFLATMSVLSNLLVDLLYAFLDPRIHYQ